MPLPDIWVRAFVGYWPWTLSLFSFPAGRNVGRLFEITAKKEDLVWGYHGFTVRLQCGRLLVDPQDFREGEQAKKTREGEDENLSSPKRLKGGEIQ